MSFLHRERRPDGVAGRCIARSRVVQASHCRIAVEGALPDACVEIYVNLGRQGRHRCSGDSPHALAPRSAWVMGPRADTLLVAKELRDCDIVAVRVHPGMTLALLGVPAVELRGELVDLDEFWGASAEHLRERLAVTEGADDRLQIAEQFVQQRIVRSGTCEAAHRARQLCGRLVGEDRSSVRELAASVGLSHRALIQLFDEHVGLKPKTFQRVQRLRRVIEAIGAAKQPGVTTEAWAALAARFGLCDQAHLIDEFRSLTSLTPTEYIRRRAHVGDGFVAYRLASGESLASA